MEERILQRKSYDFSLKIVNLYRDLVADKKEIVLAKQLLRCGTSVGANIAEMTGSQSKKDFLSKGMIAYKEARESIFWLNLLKDARYLSTDDANELLIEAEEICKIIGKIRSTILKNQSK